MLTGRLIAASDLIELPAGEVHVWVSHADRPPAEIRLLQDLLSSDESLRAARIECELLRDRFVAAHAIRRLLLAAYLDQRPRAIAYAVGPRKKPEVAGQGAAGLRFNESESGGLVVHAVARGTSVGVDIERVRDVPDADRIVRSLGSREEIESFDHLATTDRTLAFLRWWTCKEALFKADGRGLSEPVDGLEVSFSGIPDLIRPAHMPPAALGWSLLQLDPADGYVGALAVWGRPTSIRQGRGS